MPAFIVFERDRTVNQAELEVYWAQVEATLAGHPIKILAAYGKHEVLEGPPIEGAVIAEFPSLEAAKKWYFSPEYQAVAQHRKNGAAYRGFIVEGV